MQRTELDFILGTMLDAHGDVSDLNFTVNKPLQVEASGELIPVPCEPDLQNLTPYQTEMVALNLLGGSHKLLMDMLKHGSCDSSYTLEGKARFRVNIFAQRGNYSVVLRKLNTEIPTLDELEMPEIFKNAAKEKTGLILVTGATGSGKSTTLAAMLNLINETKPVHVITLEDPVEFVHPQKQATFNQRELGSDFDTFSNGLRAALRQAPKVILVGEMRDRATVEIALTAAETGHLVLSTLHTIDAGQTINRILGMFEPEEQDQVRVRMADTLRYIISQRLAPRIGGGRQALLEIMGSSLRTKETVVQGETEGKSFYEIMEASETFGWQTFDRAVVDAFDKGQITEESALQYCTKRGVVTRMLDNLKKMRGEAMSDFSDLRMRNTVDQPVANGGSASAPPVPAALKLK
jgi:twitching motility protein PilT